MSKYTIVYTQDMLGVPMFCVRRVKDQEDLTDTEVLRRAKISKGIVFIGWPLQPGEEEFDGQEA